jgi:hypothetical protein
VTDLRKVTFPRRPAGVSHSDGDDQDARALLEANGLGIEPRELIEALDADLGIFQAAAARMLGALRVTDALPALRRLADDTAAEETARVQAANALVRLGDDSGRARLVELLALDPEASPAPLQAAGALAWLGDPAGFDVVRAALESPNRVTAMVACKQLIAFAGLRGVDLHEAYERALARPERNIVGEARSQLAELAAGE